jgi:hypothetical protein
VLELKAEIGGGEVGGHGKLGVRSLGEKERKAKALGSTFSLLFHPSVF